MHVMSIHDRGRGIMPVITIAGAQLRPFDLEFLEPEIKTIQRENSEDEHGGCRSQQPHLLLDLDYYTHIYAPGNTYTPELHTRIICARAIARELVVLI